MVNNIKIGLIGFCNPGYPRESLLENFNFCQNALKEISQLLNAGIVATLEEASQANKTFKELQPDLIVVICLSSFESHPVMVVLREFFDKPIILWGIASERINGNLITSAPLAGMTSIRFPLYVMGAKYLFNVFGTMFDTGLIEDIYKIIAATASKKYLASSRIGMVGYSDLGFYTGTFDHLALRGKIGVEVEHISLLELASKMNSVPQEEVSSFINETLKWNGTNLINNSSYEQIARFTSVLRKKANDLNLNAISVKCFEGVSAQLGFTPCLTISILGGNLDCGCKVDIPVMVSMLALHGLTNKAATFFEIYDLLNESILLANCGMTPVHYIESDNRSVDKFTWGGIDGVIDASPRKEGKVTLLRIAPENGSFVMHAVCGDGKRGINWKELGWADPSPRFPNLELSLGCKMKDFVENVLGQHYAIAYGDYVDELKILAKLLNISFIQ